MVKVTISSILSLIQDKEISPGKNFWLYYDNFLVPKCLVHYIFPSLSDIQEFYQFVNGIRAEGGGDDAEDVFGGLDAMLKLNWQKVGTKVSD